MASLKEQLEQAGYDTSTLDEATVLKQLEDAGYDTSSLASQQQAPMDVMGAVKGAAQAAMPAPMQMINQLSNKSPDAQRGVVTGAASLVPGMTGVAMAPMAGAAVDIANSPEARNVITQGAQDLAKGNLANAGVRAIDAIQDNPEAVKEFGKRRATEAAVGVIGGGIAKGVGALGTKLGKTIDTLTKPGLEEARLMAQEMKAGFVPSATKKANELQRLTAKEFSSKISSLRTQLLETAKQSKPTDLPATKEAISKANAALEPLRAEVKALSEAAHNYPATIREKIKGLKILEANAKKMIGEAEKKAGIGFESTPKFEAFVRDPKKTAKLAERMGKFAATPPEQLAEKMTPQRLQLYRKLGQEARGTVSGIGNAQIQAGREQAAKALETSFPEFKQARQAFHEVKDALNQVPLDAKIRSGQLRANLKQASEALKLQEKSAKEVIKATKTSELSSFASKKSKMINDLKQQLVATQNSMSKDMQDIKMLREAAKDADAAELRLIKQKAQEIMRSGLERDQLAKKLWRGAVGAGAAITGVGALNKLGGL